MATEKAKKKFAELKKYLQEHPDSTLTKALKKTGISNGSYHKWSKEFGDPRVKKKRKYVRSNFIDVPSPAPSSDGKVAVIVCDAQNVKDVVGGLF